MESEIDYRSVALQSGLRLLYSSGANTDPDSDSARPIAEANDNYDPLNLSSSLALGWYNERLLPMGDDDLTDANIAASEARSETKLARLEGKIDTLSATLGGKLDFMQLSISQDRAYNQSTRFWLVGTIIATGLAVITSFLGLATYGDALFGRGMSVRDLIQTTIKDTIEQQKNDSTKPR